MVENVGEILFYGGKISRNVGQDGIFTQVVTNHLGYEMINRLVIGDACPYGVGQADISLPIGFDQTGNSQARFFAKNLGIKEIIVNATINNVHRFESHGGAHEDLSILRDKIAPLDNLNAH